MVERWERLLTLTRADTLSQRKDTQQSRHLFSPSRGLTRGCIEKNGGGGGACLPTSLPGCSLEVTCPADMKGPKEGECQQQKDEVWSQGLEGRSSCSWLVASFDKVKHFLRPSFLFTTTSYCCREKCLSVELPCITDLLGLTPHALNLPGHNLFSIKSFLSKNCKTDPSCLGVILSPHFMKEQG